MGGREEGRREGRRVGMRGRRNRRDVEGWKGILERVC